MAARIRNTRVPAVLLGVLTTTFPVSHVESAKENERRVSLPPVESRGEISLEEALQGRRSVREFGRGSLTLEDVSQLLWAAQGVTDGTGLRTAPSAGALYPLEVYLVTGQLEGLSAGIYRYRPHGHELIQIASGERRNALSSATLGQSWVRRAPAVIVIAAVYARSTVKYGRRGHRYTHIEVGHVAQNIYLQAVARDLGTVLVGAFDDSEVQAALQLPRDYEPLALMPVGHKR